MKLNANNRRRVAVHEAGHLVAAFAVGLPFREISIIRSLDGRTLGHTKFLPSPSWFHPEISSRRDARTRDHIEKHVISSFGGDAAEAILTGRNKWRGSEDDIQVAIDLARHHCGGPEETEAYARWLYARTLAVLRLPWHQAAIEAVADALLDHQHLGARRARALVKAAIYKSVQGHTAQAFEATRSAATR